MSDLYPLKFKPIYKEKIWGGRNLERLFGRDLPHDAEIGESWELADLPEGVSVVDNGPLGGTSLTELTRRYGGDLLGAAEPYKEGRFPLLLKLLDANGVLSLQVHPDQDAAAEIGDEADPKYECWYMIESRDGVIFKGVKEGVTPEAFREAIQEEHAEDVVRRIDVEGGDFHYLPGGMVHAIGAGLIIAEIQTPSDTTYRVTDWGRGREIHVERSMQCIRFGLGDVQPGAEGDRLLVTPYFTVAKGSGLGQTKPRPIASGHCTAIMFLGGGSGAEIQHLGKTEPLVLARPGDTILLPAGLDSPTVTAATDCEFLVVTLPAAK